MKIINFVSFLNKKVIRFQNTPSKSCSGYYQPHQITPYFQLKRKICRVALSNGLATTVFTINTNSYWLRFLWIQSPTENHTILHFYFFFKWDFQYLEGTSSFLS
jgi:hypothetical protein